MKIIVANWKMNHSFDEVDQWLDFFLQNFPQQENVQDIELVLCPPTVVIDYMDGYLMDNGFQNLQSVMQSEGRNLADFSEAELVRIVLDERFIRLGAQDCHHEESGSFTGDVSAAMLKKVGCEYVIIGHSERRSNHFATNEIIAKKAQASVASEINPIICVGEDQETRNQGKHLEFVYRQIMRSIPQGVKFKKLIIAYEPIWSIGTGVTPTIAQITEMAKLIKKIFNEKLANIADEYFMLYGGSVNSQNSKEILEIPGVNGLLVGKASLDPDEFFQICLS